MKRKIKITNTHRYTKQKSIQYNGYVDMNVLEDGFSFVFYEKDNTKVRMSIHENHMQIERFGEARTKLTMKENELTKNPIESVYGIFEIDIFTYSYLNEKNHIKVEYDVENGTDDKDGFIVELEIKEERHEFH